MHARGDGFDFRLEPNAIRALESASLRQVVLGIRPSAFVALDGGPSDGGSTGRGSTDPVPIDGSVTDPSPNGRGPSARGTIDRRAGAHVAPAGHGAMNPIELRVVVSEYLGAHSVLMTRCNDIDVLVERDSDSPVRSGTTLTFGVPSEEMMFFDPDGGARVRPGPA